MKKQAAIKCFLVSLSLVLLVSCGNTSSTEAKRASTEVAKSVSNSQPVEQKTENAYEKFREAEKENVIGDEEQQLAALSSALEKLQFEYTEVEGFGDVLVAMSPNCTQNEETGQSCMASFVYIFGPSVDPILGVGFNYVGEQYMDMDTVEIDTENYRYTFNSTAFIDIQRDKIVISPSQEEKTEEMAVRLATEDDIEMMIDIAESNNVNLRFGRYNSAKPDLVECPMPENDKQAIVDVLNAYYLYLNTTQAVRAKALAELT